MRSGSGRGGHVERECFRSRRAAAAADDDEDVAVEKAEGGGEHAAEVGNGEQCQRDADDSVQHRHHHPGRRLRRYVAVACTTSTATDTAVCYGCR